MLLTASTNGLSTDDEVADDGSYPETGGIHYHNNFKDIHHPIL